MRFIHTADWQIGKPFASIEDPSKRLLMQRERIEVIQRIAAIAQAEQAECVLVAGDLFDSPSPDRATVSAACAAIGRVSIPVYVIPGNHDHGGPGGVWEQPFFQKEQQTLAPNLHLLLKPVPVEAGSAIILPCPLLRRSEAVDTTSWARDGAILSELPADRPRILLAHGSVQSFGGVSEDGDENAGNIIDLARLPEADLDYVALGDWHGMKQVGQKAWYAGTPELDRFPKGADQQPGHVLLVETARGGQPSVRAIATARFGWREMVHDFSADPELVDFERVLDALLPKQVGEDLLRLHLSGVLGIKASSRLGEHLQSLRARLLDVRIYDTTTIAPTEPEIQRLTEQQCDPLIAVVARQLVERAAGSGNEADVARLALKELHARCLQTT